MPSVVNPSYDLDGNQITTGTGQVYTWDAENRLVLIEPVVPSTGDKKQLNVYDAQSRRVRKQVSTYASGTWSLTTDEKFIYDGWNPIAVFEISNSQFVMKRSFTWGMDLSGSMQGAGGVGGLLSVKDGSSVYYYTYDANGNVSEVLNSFGSIAAHYEDDAFGNTVYATGVCAAANVYRFSAKPLDEVSGLYYYGLRYYNPSTGRWLSRDPIEEIGGVNLYCFVRNSSLVYHDFLGLDVRIKNTKQVGGLHQKLTVDVWNGIQKTGTYSIFFGVDGQNAGSSSQGTNSSAGGSSGSSGGGSGSGTKGSSGSGSSTGNGSGGGPAVNNGNGSGIVYVDSDSPTAVADTQSTNPCQDKEIKDYMASLVGNRDNYSICFYNCRSFFPSAI